MIYRSFFLILFLCACVENKPQVEDSKTVSNPTPSGPIITEPVVDPLISEAWFLTNNLQTGFSKNSGIAGADINLANLHLLGFSGLGVRIAVSDSGVEATHPDLKNNQLTGEHRNYLNFNSQDWYAQNPFPGDSDAHGTAVTGLIHAEANNGIGSKGIAPKAKFAGFRFVSDYSNVSADSFLSRYIDQTTGNFDIFNYSYGYTSCQFTKESDLMRSAFEAGVNTQRNQKGSIYVQASGNDFLRDYASCGFSLPNLIVSGNANAATSHSYPYKIIVGATNAKDEKASYSTPGSSLWVSAPGGEDGINNPAMISTDLTGCNQGYSYRSIALKLFFDFSFHPLNLNCDYTSRMNGTSSATPVVSGVVALMLQANPQLTWRDVKHILATTAQVIDYDPLDNILDHPAGYDLIGYEYDKKWIKNGADKYFSNWYGFGKINAAAAVDLALNKNFDLGQREELLNPSKVHYYSSTVNEPIPEEDTAGVENRIFVGHDYVIEEVEIKLDTTHTEPGDLAVELTSPMGTTSKLLLINSKIKSSSLGSQFPLLSNAFWSESSYGYWKLKIIDGDTGGSGQLTSWKINVYGHKKSNQLNNPFPPTNLTMSELSNSLTSTPFFTFVTSAQHSSLIRYEAAVGSAPGLQDIKTWTSLGLNNVNQQLTGLNLNNGQIYYLQVRAVKTSGEMSSAQVKSWSVAL